jgi:TMEM175 potassium channel family protein
MPTSYNEIAGKSIERIAALSDGLFAIAMTLLILELRPPAADVIHSEVELWHALVALSAQLIMYLIGFLTLGIFWIGQQSQLSQFAHADRDLTWIHIGFLAAVALMPFSTAFLAHFITYRVALVVYWLNMLLLGIGLYGSWAYASRAGLLKSDVSAEISRITKTRILVFQALYIACVLLSVINTYWSIAALLLLQLYSALSSMIHHMLPIRRQYDGDRERSAK